MPNPYYNHTSGVPAVQTRGSSPNMRAEFDAVATGFNGVYTEILALAAAVGIAVTVSEVPVASSATTDIGNGYGPVVKITGTNPITSFGANYKGAIFLRFADALLLTHSSSLVLPGAANITTVAGDACIAIPIGNPASGWRIAAYCRMSQTLIDDVAVRTSSTYANPAWLTSLAWSKLTGTPTTISGYGISDAPTKTGTGASGSWGIDITGTAAISLANPTAAAGGTADAITATFTPNITALTNGLRVSVTGCSQNTLTNPTFAAGTTAATGIVKNGNVGLVAGDMPAIADLEYNSGYAKWVLLNPQSANFTSTIANAVRANLMQLPPVRQTVQSGPVDASGLPNFGGSTGSTTVTAAGTLVTTAANGTSGDRIGSTTNPSWTGLSTNGTMYLYLDIAADGTCTTGSTTLVPNYQFGGSYSTVSGQFTFNIQEMTGKVGNGATASQSYRVFIGEVTVAGSVVTAIVWYALQGRYRSTNLSPLNAATVVTNYNHNIGINTDLILGGIRVFAICTTSEANWPLGSVIEPDGTVTAGGGPGKLWGITGRLTASITGGSNGTGWQHVDRSAGAQFQLTTNRWAVFVVVNRGW
jgi:hypothetical protein